MKQKKEQSSDDAEDQESNSDEEESDNCSGDDRNDADNDDKEAPSRSSDTVPANTSQSASRTSAPLEVPMMMDWGDDGVMAKQSFQVDDGAVSLRVV